MMTLLSPTLPGTLDTLLALAPLSLPNHRKLRYKGDSMCVDVSALAGPDQTLMRLLYIRLVELLAVIADASRDDTGKWQGVLEWIHLHDLEEILGNVQVLGVASHNLHTSEALSESIHDVRGGALSALLGRLQMLEYLPRNAAQLNTLFILTRDHLKIMRNAVTGLDDRRREADRTPKGHDISLILEKWQEAVVGPKLRGRPVQMFMDCRYTGTLTECCLESAAIDRIFYNLTNNACRHAIGNRIDMVVFPLPDPAGETLRFVLSNEVGEKDAAYLTSIRQSGADSADKGINLSLLPLFEPKISSTGSGYGLTVVAEFVAAAFGLRNRAEALRERYVGAILEGRTFHTWFHWPTATDHLPQKLDDYHRPHESLSDG